MPPIRATQAAKFEAMLDRVLRTNAFYRSKYASLSVSPDRPPRLSDLATLPYTTKTELSADQRAYPLFGTNLTEPIERYTRVHRTSGTTGRPLYWLDTGASWQWFIDCWKEVYAAAGVNSEDRVFVAFSFGPFIGFWAAFEAAQEIGALAIPGGGMSSKQRLDSMRELDATVLVCTPTYALRLAERARQEALVLVDLPVRVTIHAGEPGASLPNVKARLEKAWGARCLDHAGATELGPWGYGCGHPDHMHINESEFCVEVIDPDTLCAAALDSDDKGAFRAGELVMTNLGRSASPLIRYRTGDLVELGCEPCACGRPSAYLRGGVLGRLDDMLIVPRRQSLPQRIGEHRAWIRLHRRVRSASRARGRDDGASAAHRAHRRRGDRNHQKASRTGSRPVDGSATDRSRRKRQPTPLRAQVEALQTGL